MGRRKWIDKKSAAHFQLVHRPQNDPRIHDEDAPSMVLNPTNVPKPDHAPGQKKKPKDELAERLGVDAENIRDNEGEAANYGIYFDDTEYNYMQHLREIGTGGGEAVFVEAPSSLNKDKSKGKQKQKQSLSDALEEMSIDDEAKKQPEALLDDDILPSKHLQKSTYQSQQDVPDAIAGFQPDMDPRLREVLVALDDEEYVDEEDEDIFQEIIKDGEVDAETFEDTYEDNDEGWESDVTERAGKAPQLVNTNLGDVKLPEELEAELAKEPQPEDAGVTVAAASEDWMTEFNRFKKDQAKTRKSIVPSIADIQSAITATTVTGGRSKKRKGAQTVQSGFSMSSSSMPRSEHLRVVDARYEVISQSYRQEVDDRMSGRSSVKSGMSRAARAPMPKNFDAILEEFLEEDRGQNGLQQLDEIRKGLGRPKMKR